MKKTIFQMTEIKSINNTEHYTWGDNCNGWHLLKTNSLSVIQEEMPSGTSEQYHFHTNSQQFFFILKGTATFYLDNTSEFVNEQKGLLIPPKTAHYIANNTNERLDFLVISQPSTNNDRTTIEY